MNSRLKLRLFFAIAAAALSFCTSRYIYLSVPTGADENSYIFQAHNFAEGRIARPAPVMEYPFKQEMIILGQSSGWLSRYPPAHSLWLVPGVWFGNLYIMIALAAALGMWFTCAAAREAGVNELFAAIPLLCSPFFGFMYGTLLSHTSGLVMTALMLWAYLRWRNTSKWTFAILAGLAWSAFFLNRTYTAMLIAVPFGIDALIAGLRDRRLARWIGVAGFAGAAAFGVLAYLVYNRLTTGDAFTATYLYYAPSETLGFGPRRTEGMTIHHSLKAGLANFVHDIRLMNTWLLGFKGSLIAWTVVALIGLRHRLTWLLAAATLSVWIGYIYFWFPGVEDAGGPVYFFDTVPLVILAGALGLQRIWDIAVSRPRARTAGFAIAAAALVLVSAGFSIESSGTMIAKQRVKRDYWDVVRSAPPNALIFIEDVKDPHIGEIVFNPRGLDSDPLLMRSMYMGNVTPMRIFSNRTPFLISGEKPGVLTELVRPEQIVLGRDGRSMAAETGSNRWLTTDEGRNYQVRIAEESAHAAGKLAFGKIIRLPHGTYELVISGQCNGVNEKSPVRVEIHSSEDRGMIFEEKIHGSRDGPLLDALISIDHEVTLLEPVIYYGGSGTVVVRRVVFEEVILPR